MASDVVELRVSFMWVESFLSLLLGKGAKAPRGFLAEPQSYTEAYRQVIDGVQEDPLLAPAWSVEYSQAFWRYYSGHRWGVVANETWRAAVPFHVSIPVILASPAIPEPLEVHGYLYPFGLAIEVSGHFGPPEGGTLALDAAVDLAHAVREQKLQLQWGGEAAASKKLLEPIASEALQRLRYDTLGEGTAAEDEVSKPFSVVTFVLVEGEDPKVKVAQGTPVHQVLQGLASWYPGWRTSAFGTLEDKRPDILSRAPAAHILYSTSRARVGWFPSDPLPRDPENRRFRSYHRNQVCTAMQMELLTRFVKRSAERIDQGEVRTPIEERYALTLAQLIGRMYGGSDSTYRSESNRFYIDQNDLKGPVNRILKKGGKPELYIPP
jgi:hypothetical protein